MGAGLMAPGGRIKALFPVPLWASSKKRRSGAAATVATADERQPTSAAKAGIGAKPPKSAKPEATCEVASAGAST